MIKQKINQTKVALQCSECSDLTFEMKRFKLFQRKILLILKFTL